MGDVFLNYKEKLFQLHLSNVIPHIFSLNQLHDNAHIVTQLLFLWNCDSGPCGAYSVLDKPSSKKDFCFCLLPVLFL